jgi:predicted nicotinamide N-methyase
VQRQDLLRGKIVVELGAGCGLPSLAAGNDILMLCEQGWTDCVQSVIEHDTSMQSFCRLNLKIYFH